MVSGSLRIMNGDERGTFIIASRRLTDASLFVHAAKRSLVPDGHCSRDGAPAFAGSPACEGIFGLLEMSWLLWASCLRCMQRLLPFAELLGVSMAFRRI